MKFTMKYWDHGQLGGWSAKVITPDGTAHKVLKYVSGGLVNFDTKRQAEIAAVKLAKSLVKA